MTTFVFLVVELAPELDPQEVLSFIFHFFVPFNFWQRITNFHFIISKIFTWVSSGGAGGVVHSQTLLCKGQLLLLQSEKYENKPDHKIRIFIYFDHFLYHIFLGFSSLEFVFTFICIYDVVVQWSGVQWATMVNMGFLLSFNTGLWPVVSLHCLCTATTLHMVDTLVSHRSIKANPMKL